MVVPYIPTEILVPPEAVLPSDWANPHLPADISSKFSRRRRERNLTQLQVAVEFGIDRTFISDVERGKKAISLPFVEVIAIGMKISLSDLLQNLLTPP